MPAIDNDNAERLLLEFVEGNYDLIRDLRENEVIHKKYGKTMARLHDIMLNLLFVLTHPDLQTKGM